MALERYFNPVIRPFSQNITNLPGAKLHFYAAGTTTPKVVYQDKFGDVAHANPVVADSTGTFDAIFLDGLYRVELKNADDVTQPGWPIDNIGNDQTSFQFSPWVEIFSYSRNNIVLGSDDNWYQSIVDNNLGNDPTASPEEWSEIAFLQYWNTNETYAEDDIVIYNADFWQSTESANQGNEPTSESPEWTSLTATIDDAFGQPAGNLLSDSGRFAPVSATSSLIDDEIEPFTVADFFGVYNGGSWGAGGKFIDNNTTNGGSAGALGSDVQALLTAMGRTSTNARYGTEFYIGQYTCGAGTSSSSVGTDATTRYRVWSNGNMPVFGSGNYSTFAAWVRVTSGSAHVGVAHTVNGADAAAGDPLGANTWQRIHLTAEDSRGYDGLFPYLYAATSAVIEIAIPVIAAGERRFGPYTSPIPAGVGGGSGSGGGTNTATEQTFTSADQVGNNIAVTLDASRYTEWQLDFNGSPLPSTSGAYNINIANLPDSIDNVQFFHIRMKRAGRKTVNLTATNESSTSLTVSWLEAPEFLATSGAWDMVTLHRWPANPNVLFASLNDGRA